MSNGLNNVLLLVREMLADKEREAQREQDRWEKRIQIQFAREERALDREQDLIARRYRDLDKVENEYNRVLDKFENYNITPEDATGEGSKLIKNISDGNNVSSVGNDLDSINKEIGRLQGNIRVYNTALMQLKNQGRILQEVHGGSKEYGGDWVNAQDLNNVLSTEEYERFKQYATTQDDPNTPEVEGLGWANTAGADKMWYEKFGGADRGLKIDQLNERSFDKVVNAYDNKFGVFTNSLITLGTNDDNEQDLGQMARNLEYIDNTGSVKQPNDNALLWLLQTAKQAQGSGFYKFFEQLDYLKEIDPDTGNEIETMLLNNQNTNIIYPELRKGFAKVLAEPAYSERVGDIEVTDKEFTNSLMQNIQKASTKNDAYDILIENWGFIENNENKNNALNEVIKAFPNATKDEFKEKFESSFNKEIESNLNPARRYEKTLLYTPTGQSQSSENILKVSSNIPMAINYKGGALFTGKDRDLIKQAPWPIDINVFKPGKNYNSNQLGMYEKILNDQAEVYGFIGLPYWEYTDDEHIYGKDNLDFSGDRIKQQDMLTKFKEGDPFAFTATNTFLVENVFRKKRFINEPNDGEYSLKHAMLADYQLVLKKGKWESQRITDFWNTQGIGKGLDLSTHDKQRGFWESARYMYLREIIEEELVATGDKWSWTPMFARKEHKVFDQDYWVMKLFPDSWNQILTNANKFSDEKLNSLIKEIIQNKSSNPDAARRLSSVLELMNSTTDYEIISEVDEDQDILSNITENTGNTVNLNTLSEEFPELADNTKVDGLNEALNLLGNDSLKIAQDSLQFINENVDAPYYQDVKTIDNTLDGVKDESVKRITETETYKEISKLSREELIDYGLKLHNLYPSLELPDTTGGFEDLNALRKDIYYANLYPESIMNFPKNNNKLWEEYRFIDESEKNQNRFKYEKDYNVSGYNSLYIGNEKGKKIFSIPNIYQSEFGLWKDKTVNEILELKTNNTNQEVHDSLRGFFNLASELQNKDFEDLGILGNNLYHYGQFTGHLISKYGEDAINPNRQAKNGKVADEKYSKILNSVIKQFPISKERDSKEIAEYLDISEKEWKLLSRGFLNGLPGGFEKSVLNLYESQVENSSLFYIGDENYEEQEMLLRQFIAMILVEKNKAY